MSRVPALAFLFLGIITMQAADVTGKWFAKIPRNTEAAVDTTFTFAVKGPMLTGTVANQLPGVAAERSIRDGKIQGNTISFTVQNSEAGDQVFKGTLTGDELKMTRTGRSGRSYEFIAKRVK